MTLQAENTISELNKNKNLTRAFNYAAGELKTELEEMKEVVKAAHNKIIEDIKKSDAEAKQAKEKHYREFFEKQKAAILSLKKQAEEKREQDYREALDKFNEGDFQIAIILFEASKIRDYKDSKEYIEKCKEEINKIEQARKLKEKEAEKRAKLIKKIAIIASSAVAAVIAFVIFLNTIIIPNSKYNKAMDLIEEGKTDEAQAILLSLGDYKDSTEIAIKISNVGDYITYGKYEQDGNESNGKEDIEWIVLDKKDDRILVISKYALDQQPYNTEWEAITWEECTLRAWLNSEFINSAFSDEEKAMIPKVTVTADRNPEYDTNPGNDTEDKVFLLSIFEAEKYFPSHIERQCRPTEYAIAQGAYVAAGGNCWWWLRSPGDSQINAAYVHYGGGVFEYGNYVFNRSRAVRPALWIEVE